MTTFLPPLFADWFAGRGWQPHPHQLELLAADRAGRSALLIAPTGGGKTLAGFLPSLIDLEAHPRPGLHTLYISPLKALAIDIHRNLETPIGEMAPADHHGDAHRRHARRQAPAAAPQAAADPA